MTPSYYPHIGGLEYVVKSIAERLVKLGHEATILAGEPNTNEPHEEEVNGVHVIRWPVWSPGEAYHIPRLRNKLVDYLKSIARDFDVIHFHSVHSVFSMYALNIVKGFDVWKVLTMHYHGTGHTLFRRLLWFPWRRFCRKLVRHVNVVHAVSRYEAELVKKGFGVSPVVVEHGVEEWIVNVEWRPENYVMYSGRIEKYKNIHRLGNIVKILNNTYGFDLELRIYGEGTYKEKLERYLRRLGIEFSIEPTQPYEKYIDILSRASLFALLSEREAFGQTINEANAIGVPAVVAEPWGRNFSNRSRTLIVDPRKRDEELAAEVANFLSEAPKQPKSDVSSWNRVVEEYVKRLYNANI